MERKPLITFIFGTRPEAIKLAPVIITFNNSKKVTTRVLITGQHREMIKQVMELFKIKENSNLDLMRESQSLTHITCKTLEGVRDDIKQYRPDLVLVQGDTSTSFSAALAAFYEKIPIGHIEAGLRTKHFKDPYPEEANRRMISQISSIHFAPTENAKINLERFGIFDNIYVTGNTVIDSLLLTAKKVKDFEIKGLNLDSKKIILSTVHRRENWGEKLNEIATGLKMILENNKNVVLILPMHKNPKIREVLKTILGNQINAILCEPLTYNEFVAALQKSTLVITDSGGIQEEAPSLGKPVLIIRDSTEREEVVNAGVGKIVGTNKNDIYNEVNLLLNDDIAYQKMSKKINPYGDGKASERILNACCEYIKKNNH